MPFYPADYLADTRRLTTEQHGAYLLLLMDSWSSGALPDDDAVLARVAGLDTESWTRTRQALAGYFEIADGKWVHARIEREREHAQAYAQASSSRGKKAATARWSKKKPEESTEKPAESVDNSQKDAQAYAQALLDGCHPQPQPQYKTTVVNDDVDNPDSSASAGAAPSSFAGPAELPEQSRRAAANAQWTRAGQLCKLVRDMGRAENLSVTAQPGHPNVLDWVTAGVTDAEAAAACATAIGNRQAAGSAQPVGAEYLSTIIAANRAAKTGGKNGAHRSRAAAAAAWGEKFAAEIGGDAGHQTGRCIDGEAVVIDAGSTTAG